MRQLIFYSEDRFKQKKVAKDFSAIFSIENIQKKKTSPNKESFLNS